MYNRKFNIKKDFSELNELENVILPQIKNDEVNDRNYHLDKHEPQINPTKT